MSELTAILTAAGIFLSGLAAVITAVIQTRRWRKIRRQSSDRARPPRPVNETRSQEEDVR